MTAVIAEETGRIVKRGIARTSISSIAFAALLSGCIFQPEPRIVQGEPYPDPNAKTQVERRGMGTPKAETVVSTSALDVTLSQATECRDQTPKVRDVTTERHANSMWQIINGSGAIIFGGLGAYALAGDCTVTPEPTASNQTPASRPCTGKEEGQATGLGVGLIATGALFGAAFIYNVIKARDSKETVPVQVARDWGTCGTRPVADTSLHLDFADGQQIVQTTNAQGQAHFDLTGVRWTDRALKDHEARLASGGQQLASVDLSGLPQYSEWQRGQQQQQAFENDRELVDKLDALIRRFETLVADLEKARTTWGDNEVDKLLAIKTVADDLNRLKESVRPGGLDKSLQTRADDLLKRGDLLAKRFSALQPKIDRLAAILKKREAAAQAAAQARTAQLDSEAIALGRQFILRNVKSPATTQWVWDRVIKRCPGGLVTVHEFDSQNGFGALIRDRVMVESVWMNGVLTVFSSEKTDRSASPEMIEQAAAQTGCNRELRGGR